MASLVDSEAQFLETLTTLKASSAVVQGLQRAGLTSYGALAYAHGQPGQPLVDEHVEQWVTQNIVPTPSIADVSMVKRLLFEAQTTVLASLKERVVNQGHDSSATPKKVPPAEREAKMAALRASPSGLLIEGPLEPSHIVLNHCAAMGQANECRYLSPEQCVSRTHEVLHHNSLTKQLDISSSSPL